MNVLYKLWPTAGQSAFATVPRPLPRALSWSSQQIATTLETTVTSGVKENKGGCCSSVADRICFIERLVTEIGAIR